MKTLKEPVIIDLANLTQDEMIKLTYGTQDERKKKWIPLSEWKKQHRNKGTSDENDDSTTTEEDFIPINRQVVPLSKWQSILMPLAFFFGPPMVVFTLPVTLCLLGYFFVVGRTILFYLSIIIFLPLILLPQPYYPNVLHSWLAWSMAKYFSFQFLVEVDASKQAMEEENKDDDIMPSSRAILVAPPHGIFPYGNLLAMIAYPCTFGYPFWGLGSSAALRPPIMKQVLRSMGVVDASRNVARAALDNKLDDHHMQKLERIIATIGIPTGGVAEVFETSSSDDEECIILKERMGIIKLAMRTGASLVPCFVFGNTQSLVLVGSGGGTIWKRLSRQLGFAPILFFGRFGLPIPFRVPIFTIMGRPIAVTRRAEQDIDPMEMKEIQKRLFVEMERIFDAYKGIYGWQHKKLIIK